MKNLFITALLIAAFLTSAFCAEAVGSRITAQNLNVKNGRLFDIKVYCESPKTLGAASFSFEYDSSACEIRSAETLISNASVRCADGNGRTDVIFLCSDGIDLSEKTWLFSVKYKKISEKDTVIKIKAYDCVDENAESFKPFKGTSCRIFSSSESASDSSDSKSSKGSGTSAKSDDINSSDSDTDTLKSAVEIVENNEVLIDRVEKGASGRSALAAYLPLAGVVLLIMFAGLMMFWNSSSKARENRQLKEKIEELEKKINEK